MHDFIGSYTTPPPAKPAPAAAARPQNRSKAPERLSEPVPVFDPDIAFDPESHIQQQPPVNMAAASGNSAPMWILTNLAQTVDRCMRIEPVYHRPRGRGQVPTPTGEYTFDAPSTLKALDLLARNMGLFAGKTDLMPTLENMPLEDLEERIQALVEAHPDLRQLASGSAGDM